MLGDELSKLSRAVHISTNGAQQLWPNCKQLLALIQVGFEQNTVCDKVQV